MTIIEIVLFVLFCISTVLFNVTIIFNRKMLSCLKQVHNNNSELLKLCEEMQDELNKKNLLIDIMLLQISSANDDYEKFTLFFQRLHFDGVPDEILKDGNKLSDFVVSLTDKSTKVTLNTDKNSPFIYNIETNIDKAK